MVNSTEVTDWREARRRSAHDAIIDAAYTSAKTKLWEPVMLEDWRGSNGTLKINDLVAFDSDHYLIKEELTHYGAKKIILKNKLTGEITEKIITE